MNSAFRIAVINDEISQDFGRSCEVAAREFGMSWIELRGMWNKNLLGLDAKEVEEARGILERFRLRVTDIASPLFKVDWPGAPVSKFSPKRESLPYRSGAVLRFLALGRSSSASRCDRRQVARGS